MLLDLTYLKLYAYKNIIRSTTFFLPGPDNHHTMMYIIHFFSF